MTRVLSRLCIILALFPWAPSLSQSATSEPLEVGVLLCLSGNCADWGMSALKGLQLAARELDERGGILGRKVELIVEDTRESISGAHALEAFKKLSGIQGLRFLIGPSWSPGGLSIAPLASRRKDLLMITPSVSAEEFSQSGDNLFNIRPTERLVTQGLAEYLAHIGKKRAAILTSSQAAESTQASIFETAFVRAGGTVIRRIETNPDVADIRTEVTQVIADKPDVLFVISYNQMLSAAKLLHSLHYAGTTATISIDDARVKEAGDPLEKWIVARALPPAEAFGEKYRTAFDEAPGLSAENGYDALHALATAIRKSNSLEVPAVGAALSSLELDGAAGHLRFNANRSIEQSPGIYRISEGKLLRLK